MTKRDKKKSRDERKKKLAALCEAHPEVKEALNIREKVGRPRIEVDQPELLKAIVDIAIHGSAAHENRRSDVYRSIKTLDELTNQLQLDGFTVSRSGIYLRLLPKRSSSLEGRRQRHVTTVPVKLIRAQNDMHLKHVDGRFCAANIRCLEELSSFLGPLEVCFLSQDDKARVPIGLTAANKQSPLLMHVEYRVTLPDHDWVVAAKHKLIPSVYAGISIEKNGFGKVESVGYSGPTYIAIRSGKHSSSTAYSHGLDFERLLEIPEFNPITKFANTVKPIVIFIVDGGPDENPRYQKTIQVAVSHFLRHNLDALFIASNAPGRSAFNRVERRMAPLSKELAGLILPHEQYGSHLDGQGKTINLKLEEENFEFAGTCLSEIWSSVVIDNNPVVAEYIVPAKSELKPDSLLSFESEWFSNHVCTSQYLTQIVKCSNVNCCNTPRSSYFNIVPSRFLPLPIPLCQTEEGLKAPIDRSDAAHSQFPSLFAAQVLKPDAILPRSVRNFKVLPYDLYCPSVQSVLTNRICKICGMYFATHVMLKKHCNGVHKTEGKVLPEVARVRPLRIAARRQRELMAIIALNDKVEVADWMDEDDIDVTGITIPEDDGNNNMPIISINDHLSSPWEEDIVVGKSPSLIRL